MRELYAAELRARTATNQRAMEFIDQWLRNHEVGDTSAVVTREPVSDTSMIVRLEQTNAETGTRWQTQIAAGPANAPAHVTLRIRIQAADASAIAPLQYDFGSPAIVRTLLRELDVYDGGVQCRADSGPEIGSSDIGDFLAVLKDVDRRLPAVVVSRQSGTGDVLLDIRELTRELAGVAHVYVLSSGQASWTLTEILGQQLSVYNGAVRVYFPGFTVDDDPYRHRLIFPDRVTEQTTASLRSWIGTLAAGAIGEHPAYAARRMDRRARLEEAAQRAEPTELTELLELYEEENGELSRDLEDERARTADLEAEVSRRGAEVDQLKFQLQQVEQARLARQRSGTSTGDGDLSVSDAVDRLEELANTAWYSDRVILSPRATETARAFATYNRPAELLRAAQSVLEAAAAYHDDVLGEPPKDFFNRRGFGYGAQPSPHLKVDEATRPDQCLRIYWDVDDDTRTWTITSIGPHA